MTKLYSHCAKYGVFSGPYFPAFGLSTERYGVSFRIQPECGKTRTRKNSVFGHLYSFAQNLSSYSFIRENKSLILFFNTLNYKFSWYIFDNFAKIFFPLFLLYYYIIITYLANVKISPREII